MTCIRNKNKTKQQSHRVGSASDLLEVGDKLSLARKLRLALGTFEVVVLQPFRLLARQRHQRLWPLWCTPDRSGLRCGRG